GVVLRHPAKIRLGDDVVVDDLVVLDAKGTSNHGITIGNGVFLGRGTILSCKDGDIALGDHTNIGFHCEIFSASTVTVGRHGLFAAYTYLVGGGHEFERADVPVLEQGRSSRGITLGDDVWLGAGTKVLDGVRIGNSVVVGAGAVVTDDLPDGALAVGETADGHPIDQVISLRFPSYAVRHWHHVCWLNHRMREYYDLWERFTRGLGRRGRFQEGIRRRIIHALDGWLLRRNVTRLVAQ